MALQWLEQNSSQAIDCSSRVRDLDSKHVAAKPRKGPHHNSSSSGGLDSDSEGHKSDSESKSVGGIALLGSAIPKEAQEEDPGSSETSQSQTEPSTEQEQQQEEEELGEELDSSIDVEGEYWIKQRDFDHSKSAGLRWRKLSGQQFRFGERKGPYTKRGRQRTIFNPKVDFPGTKFWRMVNLILA